MYYRLWPIQGVIVHKTHITYPLGEQKLARDEKRKSAASARLRKHAAKRICVGVKKGGKTVNEGLFNAFTEFNFTTNPLSKNREYARLYGYDDIVCPPGLVMNVPFKSGMIGTFDSQLAHEFFQGFANHAFVTLHIDNLRGENAHHQCETVFKAFARALRVALELDPRSAGTVPSTKGSL